MKTLETSTFDNAYARLGPVFFTPMEPVASPRPRLVIFNEGLARTLGLDPEADRLAETVEVLAGNRVPPGAEPLAQVYAGHQFGVWVPRLGDGRSVLLGGIRDTAGETWELRLKGCGPTPYSRGLDGRLTLRSALREYVASEAMHALGIPGSRSLAVVETGETLARSRPERGAVLAQLAPSHVRFGTFEYFRHAGRPEDIARLAEWVIDRHYPEIGPGPERPARLLGGVVARTAELVAMWQAAGFCHGMLNTDNMSVAGVTMDYGPFAFMEAFDTGLAPNPRDVLGRYAFDRQPRAAFWNLTRFAAALAPLVSEDRAEEELRPFESVFQEAYRVLMAAKLGLERIPLPRVDELLDPLFRILARDRIDYPGFFRVLGGVGREPGRGDEPLLALAGDRAALAAWLAEYRRALADEPATDAERASRMRAFDPVHVLRAADLAEAVRLAVDERDERAIRSLGERVATPRNAEGVRASGPGLEPASGSRGPALSPGRRP
jgi:uncharacterized protein YdiU (UPF0061 family)